MKVFHSLQDLQSFAERTTVGIGNFDGCHLGHQKLFEQIGLECQRTQTRPTILTFTPHPQEILRPDLPVERLQTHSEKLESLQAAGIEFAFDVPFSPELSKLDPNSFFKSYLLEGLKAAGIYVGRDFHFGRERSGDTDLLRTLCEKNGLHFQVLADFKLDGERVSSNSIRSLLRTGNVEKAHRFLGRPYQMVGTVIRGEGRGKGLGYPTANLALPKEKILPSFGVYLVRTLWNGQDHFGVCNLGIRPTFENPKPTLEVHLPGFQGDLYHQVLQVQFLKFIRAERKFPSREALCQQIEDDIKWMHMNLRSAKNPMS